MTDVNNVMNGVSVSPSAVTSADTYIRSQMTDVNNVMNGVSVSPSGSCDVRKAIY